jgi:imidazolonepropionase-like amidohydrolase
MLAIVGDAYVEPASGARVSRGTLLLDGDRIAAAGPRDQLSIPSDAHVIEAKGLTLLPGLIDCHVHLCFPSSFDLDSRMRLSPSEYLLGGVEGARKALEAGFTTVRDAGGTPAGFRNAIERGTIEGPRLQVAISILSQTGGHGDHLFPCGARLRWVPLPDVPEEVVDGAEEMRKRVRELIRSGSDWIKLCASGGVLSPGNAVEHAELSEAEIAVAVEEAESHGRHVMAHALSIRGIKNALHAGAKTIEHGAAIDDDALMMFLERDATLVPTLIAAIWNIRRSEKGLLPAWVAEKARTVAAIHAESFRRAREAGVRIAFGSDTGVGPQGSMGEEFAFMHEGGMSAIDCLRSATTVAAGVLGLSGQVGTLEPRAFADIIGVRGDPLVDISLLTKPKNIDLVMKAGKMVKNTLGTPQPTRDAANAGGN